LCFQSAFLCCNANNHRYLEISLSTQVCKLITIQYIYICSNKFQGSGSSTNHTGRKPLQQTIRGENPYNKPYGEETPTTNHTGRQPLQQTRSCPSVTRGVTRFNSNQINSKCCLPRFETQPAWNTHPVLSLGSTRGDPVQLRPDQLKVLSLGLKHNRLGTYTWSCPSVTPRVTRFHSNQINSKCSPSICNTIGSGRQPSHSDYFPR